MGANQIDRFGNQNISCIGEHDAPTRQMFGVRGAPGQHGQPPHQLLGAASTALGCSSSASTWCPASATTGPPARRARFHDVHRVVTNLAVLDFATPDHAMRLRLGASRRDRRRGAGGDRFRARRRGRRRRPALPTDAGAASCSQTHRPAATARQGGAGVSRISDAAHRARRGRAPDRADRHGLGGRAAPGRGDRRSRRPGHPGLGDDDLRRTRSPRSPRRKRARRKPFGVNLRADAADASDRVDLLIAPACGSRRSRWRRSRSSSAGSRPPAWW